MMIAETITKCFWCKQPSTQLRTCSKCHIAKYCSQKCQKNDWKGRGGKCQGEELDKLLKKHPGNGPRRSHQNICTCITIDLERIKALEEEHKGLERNFDISISDIENLVQAMLTYASYKYDKDVIYNWLEKYEVQPRIDYIKAKMNVLHHYWYLAENQNNLGLYKVFYNLSLSLVKYSPCAFDDLKINIIMSLIHMGREEEAFNMISFCSELMKKDVNKERMMATLRSLTLDEKINNANMYDAVTIEDHNMYTIHLMEHEGVQKKIMKDHFSEVVPSLLATKINTILRLERNFQNYTNFQTVLETCKEGDLLFDWKERYPHIINEISEMVLGFKKTNFPDMNQQYNDVCTLTDQLYDSTSPDDIRLCSLIEHTFIFDFKDSIQEIGDETKSDVNLMDLDWDDYSVVYRSRLKWIRVYWHYYYRLYSNHPKFFDVVAKQKFEKANSDIQL